MFDLANTRTTGTAEDRLVFAESAPPTAPANPLDSQEGQRLHQKLLEYFRQELDRQAENRFQMSVDADFYDNIQWTEEDAAALKERGQAPIVYNVISQSINWIIGSEKRGRVDFKVLPREKNDAKPAERKTALLKYLHDVNLTPFHRSRAFEDAVKVGIGWLEDGAQDDDDGEVLYSRYESWRNMLWDSASTELDLSDCRYVFRSKWVDVDVATAMFPDRANLIDRAAVDSANFGTDYENADEAMDSQEFDRTGAGVSRPSHSHTRRRVRLIEGWYRKPQRVKRLKGGGQNALFDPNDPTHAQAVATGQSVVVDKVMMRMQCVVFTTAGLCYAGESPYRHNRFPFTPVWCYRRDRDGMPYGYIRGLRDIQEDINKRASKALYILSTNKVIMDKGAVDDIDKFRDEIALPNAVIEKNPGKEIDINADRELSQWHLELMSRNIQMVQQVSGVTDELLARDTSATSGKAIIARQNQGSLATAKVFDNLRLANLLQGQLQLSLVEQFFTEQKQFRITNQRGTPEYMDINDGLPENDITRSKADFTIGEAEWRQSMRQAQTDQLVDMLSKMPPEVGMVVLDLVVESMDVPSRDEIVKRIRQVTGARDPEQEEPTPEEQAAAAAKQQQDQLMQAMTQAQLRKLVADAVKAEADAGKAQSATIGQNVDSQQKAIEAAALALSVPAVLPVADHLLKEAGYPEATPPTMPEAQPVQPASSPMQQGLPAQPLM